MDEYANMALKMIQDAGYRVMVETFADRDGKQIHRATATDDDGHTHIVEARTRTDALVELAKRLGFEDLD